jgi:8-oxo-dGTP pyrophosphatase MutT (NUDIX family)
MVGWRPQQAIRVLAIGIVRNGSHLLATDVRRDDGTLVGVRPIGGSVEFGETREQALHREFMEELAVAITITGGWHALENIFEFNNAQGHEIVFAAATQLLDQSFYRRSEIVYEIENGEKARATWVNPEELEKAGVELFPRGLKQCLDIEAASPASAAPHPSPSW